MCFLPPPTPPPPPQGLHRLPRRPSRPGFPVPKAFIWDFRHVEVYICFFSADYPGLLPSHPDIPCPASILKHIACAMGTLTPDSPVAVLGREVLAAVPGIPEIENACYLLTVFPFVVSPIIQAGHVQLPYVCISISDKPEKSKSAFPQILMNKKMLYRVLHKNLSRLANPET